MIQTAVQRSLVNRSAPRNEGTSRNQIPFDYAFRYQLTGKPGKVLNSTITISVGSSFTAVSMCYGVIPQVQPIIFGPAPAPPLGVTVTSGPTNLVSITIGDVLRALFFQLGAAKLTGKSGPEAILKNGFKLNPDVAEFALQTIGSREKLDGEVMRRLFQVVASPPELVQFKYAIFDEGSGREFQSEPILNIAGLGSAKGERPFRYFAKPITFLPRSTIRMEITEVSDFTGELHVALQGYKVLGSPETPTAASSQQRTARSRRR